MATRATKLVSAFPAANTVTSEFTVPTGMTFLLKSVLAWNNSGANDNVQCWLQDAANVRGYLIFANPLATQAKVEWEGIAAANPGDQLFVFSANGVSHFWVTGTKLPGVA